MPGAHPFETAFNVATYKSQRVRLSAGDDLFDRTVGEILLFRVAA
jgi:hypothetical protein